MTTVSPTATDPVASSPPVPADFAHDGRRSPLPAPRMVTTRFMEQRKRRGLMIALIAVNIGLPTVFLGIRLIAHAVDPKSYGPAGGYNIYTAIVAGVMYVFGFIVAATLGCSAGSVDLSEGMFRHLVVTGRSRLALYLARIPAGLGIVVPMVAVGFTIVCAVCSFAAPTKLVYDGVTVPPGLSRPALESWAASHPDRVLCNFPFVGGPGYSNVACSPNGGTIVKVAPRGTPPPVSRPSHAQLRAAAIQVAKRDYKDYSQQFLSPPVALMVKSGLWLELEAAIGFVVGLGLASLIGQRTIAVILMIVLELVLTPIFSRARIPHVINLQRGVVGLAMAHIEPGGLPLAFSGGGGGPGGVARCWCRSPRPSPSASSSVGWSCGLHLALGG